MLKASYGRARGTITCKDSIAIECSCDYGMPSGHSSSGCMGYLILLDLIDRRIFKTHLIPANKKNLGRLSLYVLGFCIIFSIMLSRVYQSVHLYSQVITGFSTSLTIYLFLRREIFEQFLSKLRSSVLFKIGISLLFITPLIVYIMHLIMASRSQPKSWKYWNKCKMCEKTYVFKQTSNLALLFVIPGVLIGASINLAVP